MYNTGMFDTFIYLGINTIFIVGGWYVAWHWKIKHMPFLRKLLDIDIDIDLAKNVDKKVDVNVDVVDKKVDSVISKSPNKDKVD